ncbi:hypothetical protein TWF281_009327 [Arthrobotrys megalospora]
MNPHPPQTNTRPHGNRGRGRGRGRGGPPYPRPGPSAFAAAKGPNVPRHSAIHPNTPVSIILKEDQPTGRQVSGLVADVLTRGDHHRGVKVRLKDGRVGRVQKVLEGLPTASGGTSQVTEGGNGRPQLDGATMEESPASSDDTTSGYGRSRGGGDRGWNRGNYRGGRGRGRGGFRPYSISSPRGEDGNERSEATYDLTAFIRGGRRGGRNGYRAMGSFHQGRGGFGNTEGQVVFGEEIQLSPLSSEELLANSPNDDPIARCPVCGEFEGDEVAVSHHVETHF